MAFSFQIKGKLPDLEFGISKLEFFQTEYTRYLNIYTVFKTTISVIP